MGFPSSLALISTPVKRPKTCKIKPNVPCAFNSAVYLTLIRKLQPLFLSLKDCNRKTRINRLSKFVMILLFLNEAVPVGQFFLDASAVLSYKV